MNRQIASLALLFCVGCVYSSDTSLCPCKVATDCTRLDSDLVVVASAAHMRWQAHDSEWSHGQRTRSGESAREVDEVVSAEPFDSKPCAGKRPGRGHRRTGLPADADGARPGTSLRSEF